MILSISMSLPFPHGCQFFVLLNSPILIMSSNSSTAPETRPSAAHVSGQSNTPMSRPAHSMSSEETLKQLRADPLSGLSSHEAAQRLTSAGRNELEQKKGVQPVKIFIEQIFNAMTLV